MGKKSRENRERREAGGMTMPVTFSPAGVEFGGAAAARSVAYAAMPTETFPEENLSDASRSIVAELRKAFPAGVVLKQGDRVIFQDPDTGAVQALRT